MKKPSFILTGLFVFLQVLTVNSCHRHEGHDHEKEEEAHDAHEEGGKKDAHAEGEIVFTHEQAEAAHLKTETVRPAAFSEVISVTGSILPTRGGEATVTATMAGIVMTDNNLLSDGTEVKKGQPLLTISAQGIGDGNPAAAAKAELEAAKADYERNKALAKDRLITDKELEISRQRYETALAAVRSYGDVSRQKIVTSPLNGFLKNILIKKGDYVEVGQPLATVTQNRRLRLRADVPERYFNAVPGISGANFRLTYGEQQTFYRLSDMNGSLVSRGQSADAASHYVPIIFEFDNTGNIIPGSMAEVNLLGAPRENVLSIPRTSLTEEQGVFFVYVKVSDHGYKKTEVETGANDGTRVEIKRGLKSGDEVVTRGAIQVKLASYGTAIPHGHTH